MMIMVPSLLVQHTSSHDNGPKIFQRSTSSGGVSASVNILDVASSKARREFTIPRIPIGIVWHVKIDIATVPHDWMTTLVKTLSLPALSFAIKKRDFNHQQKHPKL